MLIGVVERYHPNVFKGGSFGFQALSFNLGSLEAEVVSCHVLFQVTLFWKESFLLFQCWNLVCSQILSR